MAVLRGGPVAAAAPRLAGRRNCGDGPARLEAGRHRAAAPAGTQSRLPGSCLSACTGLPVAQSNRSRPWQGQGVASIPGAAVRRQVVMATGWRAVGNSAAQGARASGNSGGTVRSISIWVNTLTLSEHSWTTTPTAEVVPAKSYRQAPTHLGSTKGAARVSRTTAAAAIRCNPPLPGGYRIALVSLRGETEASFEQ